MNNMILEKKEVQISLEEKVKLLKEKAEKLGAKIAFCDDETPFFDEEHLNCFWYGGYIGSIKSNRVPYPYL